MIIGKIKAGDFSLFYDEDILKENNLLENDEIELIMGINGQPYNDTLEQTNKMYCADFYYPKENIEKNIGEGLIGAIFKYSTYPTSIENFISLKEI